MKERLGILVLVLVPFLVLLLVPGNCPLLCRINSFAALTDMPSNKTNERASQIVGGGCCYCYCGGGGG